jgi:hypothetical protein
MNVDGMPSGSLQEFMPFGVLASELPGEAVDEVVAAHGKQPKRRDSKLPARVMVYFALALGLWSGDDYEQVMAQLTDRLGGLGGWDAGWEAPTSGWITKARQRLGPEVLADLYERLAEPVAEILTPGAWAGMWRLAAVDGTVVDLPDTPANDAYFGRPGDAAAPGPFPQARIVALAEIGTRATFGAAIGPIRGDGTGERALARTLYPRLEEDMLLLADRGFYSFEQWCAAAGHCELLWRLKDGIDLPVVGVLADGSFTSLVFAPGTRAAQRTRLLEAARAGQEIDPDRARLVRVIEYDIAEAADSELFCLITTLLDPRTASAPLLASAYASRWEEETAIGEIKANLLPPAKVLRSKSPEMVHQELHATLLLHWALSAVRTRAATHAQVDPDRIQFTRMLKTIRRRVRDTAAFPPLNSENRSRLSASASKPDSSSPDTSTGTGGPAATHESSRSPAAAASPSSAPTTRAYRTGPRPSGTGRCHTHDQLKVSGIVKARTQSPYATDAHGGSGWFRGRPSRGPRPRSGGHAGGSRR